MTPSADLTSLLGQALGLDVGQAPFPWQVRLLDRFLAGNPPRSLDIPTGLGKTATIAIWLVARAHGAPIPRRLVYVVDRRAVVDQASDVAKQLRDWISRTPDLAKKLGLDGRDLPISTLRGQFIDNREWLEDPAAPGIIVGTVDMVGSRLLFEGYGTSRKMRPYHAGLLANDSLIVLDEAHLVPPFERLLERIAAPGSDLCSRPGLSLATPPGMQLLSLSATGRAHDGEAFELESPDFENAEVVRRLDARKALTIENLASEDDLATSLAERAWALTQAGELPLRCIIFTNRRQDAEKAMAHLSGLAGLDTAKDGVEPVADVELLVGGRRVFERMRAAKELRRLGFIAGSKERTGRPAFLFATSAGEVGVDLDADHMLCDLVPFERMVQRLGRVNRRGHGASRVHVLAQPLDDSATPEQVALHEAVRSVLSRLPMLEDDSRDASPGALRTLQRAAREDATLSDLVRRASTSDPLYPHLDRATLDAWAMTSLPYHSGRPVVGPWLRGWIEDRPQTAILWRTHLPIPSTGKPSLTDIKDFFEAAPPHASEKLETESFRVAEWLIKRAEHLLALGAKSSTPETPTGLGPHTVAAILFHNGEDAPRVFPLEELAVLEKKTLEERLLPGSTLILDSHFAGLDHGLLDMAADRVPPTIDGEHWLDHDANETRVVRFRVHETDRQDAIDDPTWRERVRLPINVSEESVSRWLVIEKWLHDAATEEDRSAGRPQLLAEHQQWAEARAKDLAERLRLQPRAREILMMAARLHDEGKAAARWQAAFRAPDGQVYAKTRGPVNTHMLDGYRHEFGSLPTAEADAAVSALPSDERDLVLHLIASHHGFARPVIRKEGGDAPPSALQQRQREVALRFARLQSTWGPWGLAWWESLLRAADQQASRANDEADRATRKRAQ